jgi:hypothetical protein
VIPRLPSLADRGRALLATRRRQHDPDGIAIDAALGAAENHAAARRERLADAAAIANRLDALPEPDPPVYVVGRFVPLVEGWRFETVDELTWVWLEARERLERARAVDDTWGLWELRAATPTAQDTP